MEIMNLKVLRGYPFDKYLSLPGNSYSGISRNESNKSTPFSPTKKMAFGTKVHQYLLDPIGYCYDDIEIVQPLAVSLIKDLGKLAVLCEPELVFTCDMVYNGLKMKYKGRADLCRIGRLIIDIKVSEMPLKKAIEYFGYDKQLSGYSFPMGAELCFIKSINPKTKQITTAPITPNADWWHYQISKKGLAVL